MSTMFDLKEEFRNKVVIIIGGSKGIGGSLVNNFLNYQSVVYYVSRTKIKNIKNKNLIHFKTNLFKKNELENLIKKINKLKKIDFLINAVAVNYTNRSEKISYDEWKKVIELNLTSIFFISKSVIKKMKIKRYGKIINISSIAGKFRSPVSGTHYVSSKSALIGMTKQLAYENAKYNLNINVVCPGQTMTEMLIKSMKSNEIEKIKKKIPLGRIASVKDQVGPILFLCSSMSNYITGSCIDVNGGQI